ncbi:IS110 family transposase [Parashewanella spongiae]|uniref:IS110 family transposase n=1 Tax=Parashewanella spongiae TaxID=342950 RepID=UPI001059561D|nr:IS110 family transposase [Parashewanella spongiae]
MSNEKNRLHKTLDDAGIRLGGFISDINGKSGQILVNGLIEGKPLCDLIKMVDPRLKADRSELMASMDETLTPSHLYILRNIKSHIEFLEKQLAELETLIIETIKPWNEALELLQTIPGTSVISAACLIGEIGDDMSCFDGMKGISSWAGLCPGNNESAGKRKSGRMRKGNKMVKTLLCEVANAAVKTKSQFKGKYQGLVIRRGHKRSIIAIAHKLLRIIYTVLSRRKAYFDPDINYEELMVRRNSPRWLQMMVKYNMV